MALTETVDAKENLIINKLYNTIKFIFIEKNEISILLPEIITY